MYFYEIERQAVFRVAVELSLADYYVSNGEHAFIQRFIDFFEVEVDDAQELDFDEACYIISCMLYERREFVAAFLTYLVVSDGGYCLAEVKELDRITMLCDLPLFTFPEAEDYLRNFDYDSILV